MNAPSFFLAALLFPFFSASAQTLVAGPAAQELSGRAPAATLPVSAGRVTYFGVVNSHDARHAQLRNCGRP
ncbi:MAG: hypothetical protein EOO59_18820 [Hymenobacter sp.]|nr:MAG: hypothetical protein EOO59_18820 [Hymenobacter sp.]